MVDATLKWNAVWLNAHIATCAVGARAPLGVIQNAAIAVKDGQIVWLGAEVELPKEFRQHTQEIYDLKGAWVTPGLIDCHTHLVYAGLRANEFARRLQGESYAAIAKAGGGILATVNATRAVTEEELFQSSAKRLQQFIAEGVTTVEIKSGYGLDLETEMKCLRVARRLGQAFPINVKTTYLGAHVLAPEFKDEDAYIDFICTKVIPELMRHELVDAIDAFCEHIAFAPQQVQTLFATAKHYGIPVKLHAEQLSNLGGSQLAAQYQALSVDHLEYCSEENIQALTESNTVGVLLPGAFYFLQASQKPPVELLRHYKIPLALATDCNPGTSPTSSLLLMLNMACVLFGLTLEEAVLGVTRYAAQALGMTATHGSLEVGKVADFAIWDIGELSELAYNIGYNPCLGRVKDGNYHKRKPA